MKLELIAVENDGDDYLITLKNTSGKRVKVWVPKEDGPDCWNFVWDDPKPFGLNLVTNSHYF